MSTRARRCFRAHALSGELAEHRWGTTPREFSPCAMVVDSNSLQLMSDPELHYRYLAEVTPEDPRGLAVSFDLGAGEPSERSGR